jgi:hypothetical protein
MNYFTQATAGMTIENKTALMSTLFEMIAFVNDKAPNASEEEKQAMILELVNQPATKAKFEGYKQANKELLNA